MEEEKVIKKFSFIQRKRSFENAIRGLYLFIRSTHSAWIHTVMFILAVSLGLFFNIKQTEWLFIFIVSGMVFISEAFNTAIEIDIDLTSPNYHPYARDTKDVAAGAVLMSAVSAVIVGMIIFIPYITNYLNK